MGVEIRDMQELRLGTVRHTGPYERITEAFDRLSGIVGAAGLTGAASGLIAIYHDDPETTPASELRADAALVVPDGTELPGTLSEQRLAAGRYACMTHVGPYEGLGEAWARFRREWLPQSGHRPVRAETYEVYHNTPGDVPAEELRTDLCIPLE